MSTRQYINADAQRRETSGIANDDDKGTKA
jgi:hypothetical protein